MMCQKTFQNQQKKEQNMIKKTTVKTTEINLYTKNMLKMQKIMKDKKTKQDTKKNTQ